MTAYVIFRVFLSCANLHILKIKSRNFVLELVHLILRIKLLDK